ncbi:hypothetical protein HJG60_011571 [Phyllostomus discolor]|uniref:Uncharacterized protein n=1 Tax=Phyllostomus discolor TaxID=89673 RepID=A0A833ZTX0_9CHIR|nr:hypothetical protein HJG60_011571 [Phyllostomus discolor]
MEDEGVPPGTSSARCAWSKAPFRTVPTRKQGRGKFCLDQSECRSFSISYSCNWGSGSPAHPPCWYQKVLEWLRRKPWAPRAGAESQAGRRPCPGQPHFCMSPASPPCTGPSERGPGWPTDSA